MATFYGWCQYAHRPFYDVIPVEIVEDAPTIEAEPVRHGQWIPDDYEYNHCSECGFEHDEPEYVTPYCPNCGANMDSED